jgi:hypothetical protein
MRSSSRSVVALLALAFGVLLARPAFGADNLKLNAQLDYNSDSIDGPLITGDDMQTAVAPGKPNYIIIYGEGCFNSKRQARRTVDLYDRYRDRVHFVIVDLDRPQSSAQQQLVQKYYQGSIPDVIVEDRQGRPLYAQAGEVSEDDLSRIFDRALQ